MCLVTPTRVPYVAPEDIYCYKVLNEKDGKLSTPFAGFPMKLGELYTTSDIETVNDEELAEGFLHAYANPSYMYKRKDWYENSAGEPAMYLAVIPKGTKFYTNVGCTELCATALKVISKIADLDDVTPYEKLAKLEEETAPSRENKTFSTYKDSLTTMENIVKFAKDNNLYEDLVRKYETFEEGSYEKNLYAYRLIVAVLTENEKNYLTKGDCYYPYVRFHNGRYSNSDLVKVGTIISNGIAYDVVGGYASYGTAAGLGDFYSGSGVSGSWAHVGFRSVSSREIAKFISRHFGKIVFDLMYGCANCDYRWVEEGK